MRLSFRFIVPLAITLGAIAYAVVPLVDKLTLKWFVRDLDIRTSLIANTMQERIGELVHDGSRPKMLKYLNRIIQNERLFALGYCDAGGKLAYRTTAFPDDVSCDPGPGLTGTQSRLVPHEHGSLHVA